MKQRSLLFKILRAAAFTLAALALLALVNFFPTFSLKMPGMQVRSGKYVTGF